MKTRPIRSAIVAFAALLAAVTPALPATAAVEGPNLASGRTVTASSSNNPYVAANANDGNQSSYWESTNNAFPQWLQVDLGATTTVHTVVLKLPVTNWGTRTQTLAVQASTTGSGFADIVGSTGYSFNPASANTVTISFTATATRFVRVLITANTGWPAGQVSEFEVYGPATGDTQPPTTPGTLSFTQPSATQIALSWGASTDNVGVSGYNVYRDGTLLTTTTALSYTDTQPASATVSYVVRARDAAGNQSPPTNTVTRPGSGPVGTNLAPGRPITASSSVFTFVAANANDENVATYWESGSGQYPATLTVALGANADLTSIVLKLNPDPVWGTRQQNIEVLGREQSAAGFTSLAAPQTYTFNPATGNSVTIGVGARVADVAVRLASNTGAPGGQVAELQVIGASAPNPDLTVQPPAWTPTSPVETDAITVSATVRNTGTAPAPASGVNFYLGTTLAGSAAVGGLAAGATATVSANIGARDAGSYQLTAKVDEPNTVIELNEGNNAATAATALVVTPVASADLVTTAVSWTQGNTVTFTVSVRNQGTIATAGGSHGVTLTVANAASGATVATFTGSFSGSLAAGASAAPVTLGPWSAANGRYTVRVDLVADANELPVKRDNNSSTRPMFVGRGANLPFEMYEAEDGTIGGGATVVGPNRTVGDLAGEASGRRAVTLNTTGSFVEWTTRASTNTLVVRFSIPDGTNTTLNIYVNGAFLKPIDLTAKFAWLYGQENQPSNSPGAGAPRHIYDEANVMLGTTVAAGSRIRLQKDAANTANYAVDFVSLEQATAVGNPDPARYAVPTGFSHQNVQDALDRVRMDNTGTLIGVYLPAGDYQTANKFQVYGKAVQVVGAGPWFTRFRSPSTQDNTDVGFRVDGTAAGSAFRGFAYFGNYIDRIDGPGKVFDLTNVSNLTIDNIWVEHQVVMVWGTHVDHITVSNSRIRNTFADGVNLTNGSQSNVVTNIEARGTGDDSFALFAATDFNSAALRDNVYSNLTSLVTWRAAGIAVYGGFANTFENLYVADTLVYSAITISSLDFGYPFAGFGASPPTVIRNASLVRAGGHFWGQQTFPAIWVFSASKAFQGIRVSDVDIVDPTYSGIMFQTAYLGTPLIPITDTTFTNISITGAQRSGDAFDAKSGFGIWVNELPEPGQGPAVGSATFTNLTMSNNATNIKNTTTTFTVTVNP